MKIMIQRRKTRQISIGSVTIGGDAPISVQSMTKTDTRDVRKTVNQILRLEKDRVKPNMRILWPLALLIRLSGFFASAKRRENYRLDETLSSEILMGGNTLILVGEKVR